MSWLRDHLHSFTYPNLAKMKNASWDKDAELFCKLELESEIERRFHTPHEHPSHKAIQLIYAAIDRLESLMHRNTKSLILTGRDTWHFYAVAMSRKFFRNRTFFFPQINRHTSACRISVDLLINGGLKEGDILFDTGHVGSVFSNLTNAGLPPCDFYLLSKTSDSKYKTLFFRDVIVEQMVSRRRSFYSELGYFLRYETTQTKEKVTLKSNADWPNVLSLEEQTPKYWKSAFVSDPFRSAEIKQPLTNRREFLRCAADTCLILERRF